MRDYSHSDHDCDAGIEDRRAREINLETLRETARLSSVPHLAQAAGLALSILDLAEKAQANKEELYSLGDQCIALVYIIQRSLERHPDGDQIPSELQREPSTPTPSSNVYFFRDAPNASISGPFTVNYVTGNQHVFYDPNRFRVVDSREYYDTSRMNSENQSSSNE
ncbi:hypothetical protein VKT23_008679 [Stygiomarasmius scandens]|uniref:Uncharacterized protein n=1 Tax=Marasmiellus scandens TaxID=2682957 RepID=A0ABR1JI10_9AGAR